MRSLTGVVIVTRRVVGQMVNLLLMKRVNVNSEKKDGDI